jgi:hypothetical protein
MLPRVPQRTIQAKGRENKREEQIAETELASGAPRASPTVRYL